MWADLDESWSFGRKIGIGFGVVVGLTLLVGVITTLALRDVVSSKDRVLDVNARGLVDARLIEISAEKRISATRGFLITGEQTYIDELVTERGESSRLLDRLTRSRPELRAALDAVRAADDDFRRATDELLKAAQAGAPKADIEQLFVGDLRPRRRQLAAAIDALTATEDQGLTAAKLAATAATEAAITKATTITIGALLAGLLAAVILTRTLGKQIGHAVSQVQSSSAELQAAANQQAAGIKQQATAINEITTTISELLTTSRQIAESAQRVTQMALETGGSARIGDQTVGRANDSFASIQRQVELIVLHMLELGRKSQQIGTVLEIVADLAEQTNILAINATIEAGGAGEAGRRFAVVADEIRKLADRVAGSTKEIRTLIDDVRSAVNTTVMATETGSKTVEAGSRQFGEVTVSLRQISGLVGNTSEAAREIELSTKQQSTAVEQVNVAIANVAQASREAEASAKQTLQTAAQLATLSRDLLKVVQPRAA
jgi:methyl-accepting chemotaxis protein/CBS domain-containing protein